MTLSTRPAVQVSQFKVDELQPGETVVVTGKKINPKGRPVNDVTVTFTVTMSDEVECNNAHPFTHITKLWGVGITSTNHKLLTSRAPHETNWVGNELTVGERWQAGTYRNGRAILVDSITVNYN